MSQYTQSNVATFVAGAAIGANLRVIMTAGKLAVAGDGATDYANEIGTTLEASFAANDIQAVLLRNAPGTRKCIAATAVVLHAPVYGAASGKVDDAASGTQLGIASAERKLVSNAQSNDQSCSAAL